MATTYEWERLGGEIMDSRDLIAVAEEIREALDALDTAADELALEALESSTGVPEDDAQEAREILAAIDVLADAGISDWEYGETFIREDYFTDYAQELAEDIGAIPKEYGWPTSHIDWEAASDALRQDYLEVDFRGTTYYVRA